MTKRTILIQLDPDRHPSVFDRIVAIDAGADEVLSYGGVEPDAVESLVHGAIFTRSPKDLRNTAVFIGGKSMVRAEEILAAVLRTFFGPLRCSLMIDANGANTTAAAAVLAAGRHLDFPNTRALVLGGTGPVGQRSALLLARQGATVWLASRSRDRAADACDAILGQHPNAQIEPVALGTEEDPATGVPDDIHLVISAAAAGVRTLTQPQIDRYSQLKVLIDLNAVPPSGIEGVELTDDGRQAQGIVRYGALMVGGAKMRIHKAAIRRLFESNDQVLDAAEVFDLGLRIQE